MGITFSSKALGLNTLQLRPWGIQAIIPLYSGLARMLCNFNGKLFSRDDDVVVVLLLLLLLPLLLGGGSLA